jgi:chromosome partitioning protein
MSTATPHSRKRTGPVVLTVAQQKGGVGKTTLSRLFAIYGAREDLLNKRVLLLDFDYQASISKLSLTGMQVSDDGATPPIHPDFDPSADDSGWNGHSSTADIFFEGFAVPYAVELPYPIPNLEILPAHKAMLKAVEEQDRGALREKVINRLHEFLSLPEVAAAYDIVVIDTGPKDSPLVRSAIRASTHLVIPLVMEAQCIDGLAEMLGVWRLERSARSSDRPLVLSGLVVNQFDARYATHQAFLNQLHSDERIAPMMLETILQRRAAITDRDTKGAPAAVTFDLPRSADVRDSTLKLCAAVYSQIFPDEAARLTRLEPDERYSLNFRTRLARHAAESPAPQTDGAGA